MIENNEQQLKMTFDPLVIDDLGAKLYSTLPPIISELIANGYDACAQNIWIELKNDEKDKSIILLDDGMGMNFDDIDKKYLLIGRKRRDNDKSEKLPCGRLPIGKKGLGKLSFFGVAKKAVIETVKDNTKIIFEMDWDKIQTGENPHKPYFEIIKNVLDKDGTKITLTKIYRKTDFDVDSLKRSISNYFIFDKEFKVHIKKTGDKFKEITNELRYKQSGRKEDFSWSFPKTSIKFKLDQKFPFSKRIKGKIILFDKPVRNKLRGVTLFSRKKLVNLPEFFPVQGSSFFFQYLTGWLEVDFIDEFKPDVISTNRSNLAWNDENLQELTKFLEEVIGIIHKEWRKLKSERTNQKIKEKYNIDTKKWRETNENNPVIIGNIDKITKIFNDPERIEEEEITDVLGIMHSLAPDNADFVLWAGLHKKVTENKIIKEKFFSKRYLEAAREAVQIYNEAVQVISKSSEDGCPLMDLCFKKDGSALIHLTDKSSENEQNIDLGHQFLSKGVITGFRNPALGHTSLTKAEKIKHFTDRNCLDILSTISYLFNRLENRKKP
ncbi:MAG: TIGR02391 family protein [Candidatus Pacebacteria bacterium]|nr:TIGR02391 family protein [Candidatus Paceibacterota bacterium]